MTAWHKHTIMGLNATLGERIMPESQDEQMLTVKQVAERLNVDEKTVRRWIQRGDLVALNIGRLRPEYRVSRVNLNDFMQSRQTDRQDN